MFFCRVLIIELVNVCWCLIVDRFVLNFDVWVFRLESVVFNWLWIFWMLLLVVKLFLIFVVI